MARRGSRRRDAAADAGARLQRPHVVGREQLRARYLVGAARTETGEGGALPRDGAHEGDEVARREAAGLPLA